MVKGKTVRNDLSRSNGPKVSVASSWKDMRAILKEGRWGLSKHRHRLRRMVCRFLQVLIDWWISSNAHCYIQKDRD